MYKVKIGGKNGQTINLVESQDMVVIRTKDNQDIKKVALSRSGREVIENSQEVVSFPEAGISVRRVKPESRKGLAGKDERDTARTALKEEENIRFAGRVLQDKESGEVMLYTENFFVKFTDDTSEKVCLAVLERYNLRIKSKLEFANNAYFVEAAEGTGLEVFNIAEKLLAEKNVEYCHPEMVQERRYKNAHPLQWHLTKTTINGRAVDAHVNIEKAWSFTRGQGVTIAIIDDGVEINHPEFAGRVVFPFDVSMSTSDPQPKMDDDDHGTACAGMACAAGLPNGASGTAPEANLMPIRLRSALGSMAEANAFAWAANHGADVISCSWGPPDGEWWNPMDSKHNAYTPLFDSTRLAMEYALTKGRNGKGSVILFAAGNGNEDIKNDGYASYPGVIAVAACNDTGKRAVYSDFGEAAWVCFPSADFGWSAFRHPAPLSEGLRTTDRIGPLGYTPDLYTNSFGGTSAACPGVAGIVALMLAVNPDLTPPQVKDLLRHSCTRIDEAGGEYKANGHSIFYGYGRIDAALAVENAAQSAASSGIAPAKSPGTVVGANARNDASTATTAEPQINGTIKFTPGGDLTVQPGALIGDGKPVKKVLGISLYLKPAVPGLTLRYKINASSDGIVQSGQEGEFIGVSNARRRIMGVSVELEGANASRYDIEYAARLKGRKSLAKAKNGAWCGTSKKSGRTIEAISISLRKK